MANTTKKEIKILMNKVFNLMVNMELESGTKYDLEDIKVFCDAVEKEMDKKIEECDIDCHCSECSQLKSDEFETKISGDKSNIEIRGYQVKNGILLTREASLRLAEIINAEMKQDG